jgi:hypothetical protein
MGRARDIANIINSGNFLTTESASTIYATNAGMKKIVQVVNSAYNTEFGTNSSTYANTGLSATITPTSASNKILIFVTHGGVAKFTTNTWGEFKLVRNSTDLLVFETQPARNDTTATNNIGGISFNYLDSPSTTSSITYKTMVRSPQNTGTVYVQLNSAYSSIVLMEITV